MVDKLQTTNKDIDVIRAFIKNDPCAQPSEQKAALKALEKIERKLNAK